MLFVVHVVFYLSVYAV